MDRDEVTKVADFGLSRETVEDVYEVTKVAQITVYTLFYLVQLWMEDYLVGNMFVIVCLSISAPTC